MKKAFVVLSVIAAFLSLFSCASLQEDVMVTSAVENSIVKETGTYEDSFLSFDSARLTGGVVSMKEMDRVATEIESKITAHTEPAVEARFRAIEGLLCLMQNKTKKARELYDAAKNAQAGDVYVLLLNSRLQRTSAEAMAAIEEYLLFDTTNPLFLLEKGILLYKESFFGEAVANFDSAFLLFDQENKPEYRDAYSSIRDTAWKYHSTGADKVTVDTTGFLTCERMVALTMENTDLLEDFVLDSNISASALVKKLEKSGFFTAVGDTDPDSFSSKELTGSSEITRTQCARFLWNVYIHGKGNAKLRNMYSARFSRTKDQLSPVEDVQLTSIDFDACIGVVEKEIINLTDGRLFEGDKIVSEIDFLEFVKNCEKAVN